MTHASGAAPYSSDYGYATSETEWSYGNASSASSDYGYYDPYGGYDTTATEGSYGYVKQSWWDKVSQTQGFKQTMSVLEAVGGIAEVAAGAALCSTGIGCILGGAMMIDGAAHFGSGVMDFGDVTFGDGDNYGQHNVLRNLAMEISPEYGSVAYDLGSTALGLGGGYVLARQSMAALASGESLLGTVDVIAPNQSGLSPSTTALPGKSTVASEPATVDELLAMMNKRTGVTAEYASGDSLEYLQKMGAEGSHMMMEDGTSQILLR